MSPRAGLDRERVVRTAAALIDAPTNGQEELSLSRLAEQLGVRTPSLYKHVDGLPALRRDLTLLGLRELGSRLTEAAAGRSGDQAIRAIAAAYRDFAHQHPGLYAATQRAPDAGDAELVAAAERVVSLVLRVLEAYGL